MRTQAAGSTRKMKNIPQAKFALKSQLPCCWLPTHKCKS